MEPQPAAPSSSSTALSYPDALARLAQLQSNHAITSLFTSPTPASGDLNAAAIPEMLAWLRRAGYSPAAIAAAPLRCVHVAGTKGKGSVAALVAAILQQYQSPSPSPGGGGDGPPVVGLYTSPHVLSPRERIVLGGQAVSEEAFARGVAEVWARLTEAARREAREKGVEGEIGEAELDGPATKPFYFRFLTLLALHLFVGDPRVRDVVVECGIGGEYDATNMLPAGAVTAVVVTQLGVDHVSMLGDTVEKIAWHKSGIFKRGVRAFTRRLPDNQSGVMEVLRARAGEKGAILVEIADEDVESWGGVEGTRLQGPFQKYNMALAVHAAREHLLRTGVELEGRFGTDEWSLSDIPEKFIKGLREAALRGRCEILMDREGIEWHLDGAHTDDSLAGVGEWFADRTRPEDAVRVLVFNQQERDPAALLRALLAGAQRAGTGQVFTHAIFTRNEGHRPAEGEGRNLFVQNKARETMRDVDGVAETEVLDAAQSAVERVREIAAEARKDGKTCKVLVTGSFHLVGAVLKIIDRVEC
ncbi:Folylpolyglutamate synthase [Madurella mycetomatis]|uniref:Folylpolyglutamate synthase n=1 Tax=Madurella mycetomatis TaxID=100816 RepID=A0A175WIB3_9PEZI|nr:Folylpolyglutamate synthase [Madurella mycetomatis]